MDASLMSRRAFLVSAAVGSTAIALAGCSNDATHSSSPPTNSRFVEPSVLRSTNGRLEVTLVATAGTVANGGGTRFAYTYNGGTPGPTLRVRPGDRLVITLDNQLDQPTNLHTHGLHVSPEGDADNIFVMVEPGARRTYRYDIPGDHRSGLFWYHPHAHGNVADQVAAGLAGAIVVVDALDEIEEITNSTERVMVLSDPTITSRTSPTVSHMTAMQGREGDTVLVNGAHNPRIEATAGGRERWRIVNASSSRYYRLALDGHQMTVIASDGGRLATPAPVDELLLAPGERTEVLVTPTKVGSYTLRTLAYDRGSSGMGSRMGMMGGGRSSSATPETVATLRVDGNAAPATIPTTVATSTPAVAGDPAVRRDFRLSEAGSMMSFTINGNTFDASRTDVTATLGTVEEWRVTNPSAMDHPFHLHVWPFVVVDGPATNGWKDTVNVAAGSTVTLRVPFTDIPGRAVYHCHILDHEDLGMMGTIDVVEPVR